ncbi:MAG: DUF4097 family beta strand repeat-containing protein [Fidelibacterota bacterium]
MKRIITLILLLSTLFITSVVGKEISRVFPKKAELEIDCVLGSCEFQKSADNRIHITVDYSYKEDYFTPVFDEQEDKLVIEEDLHENGHDFNNQNSNWIIKVPDGMEIEFSTATGKLSIKDITAEFEGTCATGSIRILNANGEFEISSGTGNIELENCSGEFELNSGTGKVIAQGFKGELEASSGTGKVEIEELYIMDFAELNSGTGDVELIGFSGENFELELNSGTGDVELDMNGKKIQGHYTLSTIKHAGKIESDYKFDHIEEYNNGGEDRIRKSFSIGKADNTIEISSGTGNAVLKK